MEELRKAQAQAEARAAQFRKLVTQFKTLTDAGKLQVEIRENRMIVRLGDKILFDPGKTDLKPEGKDALTQVTDGAEGAPEPQLPGRRPHRQRPDQVEALPLELGPVDGARGRGRELHDRRSGMEPKRLSAAGYADSRRSRANDTPENKAKNRRIEITLVPNLDDLPPIDEALKESPVAEPAATPPAPTRASASQRRPWTPRRSPSRGTRSPGRPRRPACAPRPSCAAARSCGWSSSGRSSSSPTGARAATPGWCSRARWS